MQWGERKKRFTVKDFRCVCGNDIFDVRTSEVDYTEWREKYDVITCSECGCRYRKENGIVFRQSVFSDNWEPDIRPVTIN